MIQLQAEIKALAKSHPIPQDLKLERRMSRINRMIRFYEEKAPIAPEKQGDLFRAFASSLIYAATIIKMYRKLTKKITELANETEEKDND